MWQVPRYLKLGNCVHILNVIIIFWIEVFQIINNAIILIFQQAAANFDTAFEILWWRQFKIRYCMNTFTKIFTEERSKFQNSNIKCTLKHYCLFLKKNKTFKHIFFQVSTNDTIHSSKCFDNRKQNYSSICDNTCNFSLVWLPIFVTSCFLKAV